ncbi:MAG: acyclic terpene utilization AtuA family protein [Rhodobacteraceae bacterium]|nr:acyclic terpene utilization AtuA family protein [Paracoccaceae bacterium]
MSAFTRLRDRWPGPDAPLRILGASGQLGLGIPEEAFRRGIAARPHVIAADMGSVDPGPAYLGSGRMAAPKALVRRDLELVLKAARDLDVPLLIGSAGTAGAAPHLEEVRAILAEVAAAAGLSFRLGLIRSDVPGASVEAALTDGRLRPIGDLPADHAAIRALPHIVAQAGMAPFIKALEQGADVVLAGRACDTAPFAVIPVLLGYEVGPAMHMGKILECTSLCCEPGGRDAILGTLEGDSFTLESMSPERRATPRSVAAHALYEQADPFEFREPAGAVRLDQARYEAAGDRRVRVSGARWEPAEKPTVKIEGARRIGARAVGIYAAADPEFIRQSDQILRDVQANVRQIVPGNWSLYVRRYGIDGVTPAPEGSAPHEIALLIECVAPSAERARTALAAMRQQLLHFGFPGRRATGGNLAIAFTPAELDAGEAWEFSLYHIMELQTEAALDALFPVSVETIGGQP